MAEIRLRSNSGIVTEARKCLNSPNVPKISIQFGVAIKLDIN